MIDVYSNTYIQNTEYQGNSVMMAVSEKHDLCHFNGNEVRDKYSGQIQSRIMDFYP